MKSSALSPKLRDVKRIALSQLLCAFSGFMEVGKVDLLELQIHLRKGLLARGAGEPKGAVQEGFLQEASGTTAQGSFHCHL